jgi:hypothetical protein
MSKLIFCSFFFVSFFTFGQSEWFQKPFIVLKDSSIIEVKRPVFIFGKEVICHNMQTVPISIPLAEVQHVSKTCFIQTLRKGQIDRLGNSNHGKRIFNISVVSFGSLSLLAVALEVAPKNNAIMAAICYSMAITNKIIMHKRKLRNRMIFESMGIKIE